MTRKMTSVLVVILALLLVTATAWSSTSGNINPTSIGKILTTDLTPTIDYPLILAGRKPRCSSEAPTVSSRTSTAGIAASLSSRS